MLPVPAGHPAQLGSRALFPHLEARCYWNHAAVSPPSTRVVDAVSSVLALYASHGVGAYGPAAEQRDRLRSQLASMLGCSAVDLALTGATSQGIIALATCIPFTSNDRILCFRGEFPANTTPWQEAARATDASVDLLDQEGVSDDDLLADVERHLRAGGVRLIAASAVQFSTGRAMPLKQLSALAHAHGAELAVDGIQAVGVMPLDVRALGIDYLASGGHKWTMGIEGSGFLYVAPERLGSLQPRSTSWLSLEDPLGFLMDGEGHLTYDRSVRRETGLFEGHSLSAVGCAALEAGLSTVVEIGLEVVQAHVRSLNDALEAGLLERGFSSLRLADSPSGTLSMVPNDRDALAWAEVFAANGVSVSTPDGKLRFSPHWPNAIEEVHAILEVVDRAR